MKLKIKDLAKEVKICESNIRTYLGRTNLACFVTRELNEYGHPVMFFDLNETSKKLLLQCKKGYKPNENEDLIKYIDENIKLQKDKIKMVESLQEIKKIVNHAYCNEFFISLTKKDTDEILKIIKDVL